MNIGGIFIFGAEFAFVVGSDVVCLSGEFGGRLVVVCLVSGLVTVAMVEEFDVESDESDSKSDSGSVGIGEGGVWRWRPFL